MKTLRIFLLILIIIGLVLIFTRNLWVPKLVNKIIEKEFPQQSIIESPATPISITEQKISEENFTGTIPIISGTSPLATKMREYVNKTISDFRTQANTEVPDIKKNFGEDVPTSTYEIYITSKYIKGSKTESVITSVYTFTGGAHGSTLYKVITANLKDGTILSLSNIVKKEKQNDFTNLVKEKLIKWIPQDSDTPVVFPESVADLKFSSFSNWAINGENLIIYFDQYAVGPGALGSVEFPIPLKNIKLLLNII